MRTSRLFALFGVVILASACTAETGGQETDEFDDLRAALQVLADSTPAHLAEGQETFVSVCASCHGPVAGGTPVGPPLVHMYYRPNRHADVAFFIAISRGVRAHHWRYGDMPPVRGVDQQAAEQVVAYVRWLQRGMGVE
jgi:mono/diheme cytochrome c family protein